MIRPIGIEAVDVTNRRPCNDPAPYSVQFPTAITYADWCVAMAQWMRVCQGVATAEAIRLAVPRGRRDEPGPIVDTIAVTTLRVSGVAELS